MDISASQYNSASESGWTHYLDQSSLSENHFQKRGEIVECEGKGARMEEEEEDLSMLSDASSAPPHYPEEEHEFCRENWFPSTTQLTKESGKKKEVKEYGRNQRPSSLADTASSPVISLPKARHKVKKKVSFSGSGPVDNALDFSQGLSDTRKNRKPRFRKHFSFFERSLGGKQATEEQGGFSEQRK